ncbi:MAG: ATP-grasp domain-containing protein [Acidobacteriota bacterium]|nr:ATP-grasp domain-containing protein [Acidobacteriota bacterium]
MRSAIIVAPFLAPTTLRFVRAAAALADARVGLITQEPQTRIPGDLRRSLAACRQVEDALEVPHLIQAIQAIGEEIGPPERLFGVLEQLQEPLAEVRQQLGIPGLSVEASHNYRDKALMKEVFRKNGVPCAAASLVTTVEQAVQEAEIIGYPLVVKPPSGAGAKSTFRVDNVRELREGLVEVRPSKAQPLLLEEFVVGREHSFDAVCIGDRPVWHSLTHYTPGPLEVLENPWIQWTVLLPREVDHPRYDDVRKVGADAIRALGMHTGLYHMEWFRRPDGSLAVSEIAARPPGAQFTTLISYAHDMDFYEAWARLMIFDRFDPPQRAYAAGIVFLRGQGRGRVRAIRGLEEAQRELGSLVVEVELPQQGQLPASSYEGEGFVVLRHPRTEVVQEALARLVRSVRVELG